MSILCIVASQGMAEAFRRVAARSDDDIVVMEGLLEEAVPIASRFGEDADVIVSRGGTVLAIRAAGITTPIVELQVTAKDIATALEKAEAPGGFGQRRIAVVAFANMTQQLKDYLPFFSVDMNIVDQSLEEDLEATIHRAIAGGFEILLGGVSAVAQAKRMGIPAVLIESGESSIAYALEEARTIVSAQRLRDRRAEELRIISESISEGILASDASGGIVRMNHVAQRLLGLAPVSGAGPTVRETQRLPQALAELLDSTRGRRRLIDLGPRRIMVDSNPVKVAGAVTGTVFTLQDVTEIQAMEAEIRRELYSRGHVARHSFGDIVAEDPVTLRCIDLARRYAATNASILIRGESGSGKEVFAQSIHTASSRSSRAFVAMNCAAIPESLAESELFGYVDGAFTGARKKGKPGLFEMAHGGTIFLDEISEMPLALQARLLRVLQEHQAMRLGDHKIIPVDVRIIAATNRDLPALVAAGTFRNDLYWRLNVLNLALPPLRERRGDIIPLVDRMLADCSHCASPVVLSPECLALLQSYDWPGNVREVANFCERVAAICDASLLDESLAHTLLGRGSMTPVAGSIVDSVPQLLPAQAEGSPESCVPQTSKAPGLRGMTEAAIDAALRDTGNLEAAARLLGIHRTTLWRHLRRRTAGGEAASIS